MCSDRESNPGSLEVLALDLRIVPTMYLDMI